jgi:tetraacyldisaccharide 4'-kinase
LRAVLGLGAALEQGRRHTACSALLTRAWRLAMARAIRRDLRWPAHTHVLAVGGATLGGSGKTPLAISCAAALAELGIPTALVGHAYRGEPRYARIVTPADPIEEVGDEALLAADALRASGARVVVGPSRQAAIDLGAKHARMLVLDGVHQTAPMRASLALLAVDAVEPWGRAHALPPVGDLRAYPADLVDVCDVVVPVGDRWGPALADLRGLSHMREVSPAWIVSRGAWAESGSMLSWEALRSTPVGLITALARPDRVVQALARRGVRPRVLLHARNHGPLGGRLTREAARAGREAGVTMWLVTPKCSLNFTRLPLRRAYRGRPDAADTLGAPLATLEHRLVLSEALVARIRSLVAP